MPEVLVDPAMEAQADVVAEQPPLSDDGAHLAGMANGLVPRRREVIAPGEAEYLRAVLLRNLRRAVARARVDDNNLVHLALQTAKAASQVGFFVLDDHAGGHHW